ncbi:MAG TPA: zinc metallopeptidase [Bacteroidia bacterium]|nr:zinc metallopeptidase [Bacteroidia bacterium]
MLQGGNVLYLIVTAGAMLASWLVGMMLQRRFREYSQSPTRLTGAQVAEQMLRDNGIGDVRVISTPGQLTDHYNPLQKTVNLSEVVYHQANVAAAAVAAHECGHAVQHARAYAALKLRSALVPLVNFSSRIVMYILAVGLMLAASGNTTVLLIGVILFAMTTLFSVVTLPVEFDASRRALAWLDQSRVLGNVEHDKAKNALFWAAMTYTVAAIASVGQLLYFVMRLLAAQRRS